MTIATIIGGLAVLLVLGFSTPVAVAVVAILAMPALGLPVATVGQKVLATLDNHSLVAIPLFVLYGRLTAELTPGAWSSRF